jgi:hypothetical protein
LHVHTSPGEKIAWRRSTFRFSARPCRRGGNPARTSTGRQVRTLCSDHPELEELTAVDLRRALEDTAAALSDRVRADPLGVRGAREETSARTAGAGVLRDGSPSATMHRSALEPHADLSGLSRATRTTIAQLAAEGRAMIAYNEGTLSITGQAGDVHALTLSAPPDVDIQVLDGKALVLTDMRGQSFEYKPPGLFSELMSLGPSKHAVLVPVSVREQQEPGFALVIGSQFVSSNSCDVFMRDLMHGLYRHEYAASTKVMNIGGHAIELRGPDRNGHGELRSESERSAILYNPQGRIFSLGRGWGEEGLKAEIRSADAAKGHLVVEERDGRGEAVIWDLRIDFDRGFYSATKRE